MSALPSGSASIMDGLPDLLYTDPPYGEQTNLSRQHNNLFNHRVYTDDVSPVNYFSEPRLTSPEFFGGRFAFDTVSQSAPRLTDTRMRPPPLSHFTSHWNSSSYPETVDNGTSFSDPEAQRKQLPRLSTGDEVRTTVSCPDCGITLQGPHELQCHRKNMHDPRVFIGWVSPPRSPLSLPHHASNSDPHSFPEQLDTSTSFSGPEAQKQPIPRLSTVHQTKAPLPCPDCHATLRGFNELQRHWENVHAPVKRVWICVQPEQPPLLPKKSLDTCKPCKEGKHYNILYNAAAHLRRVHFNPSTRSRSPRRGDEYRSPAIEDLKAQGWLKEIAVTNNLPRFVANRKNNGVNWYDANDGIVSGVDHLGVDATSSLPPLPGTLQLNTGLD